MKKGYTLCSWCGHAIATSRAHEFDRATPFCSERCFEQSRDNEAELDRKDGRTR